MWSTNLISRRIKTPSQTNLSRSILGIETLLMNNESPPGQNQLYDTFPQKYSNNIWNFGSQSLKVTMLNEVLSPMCVWT